jgi:hypothetical protein
LFRRADGSAGSTGHRADDILGRGNTDINGDAYIRAAGHRHGHG